MGLTSSTRLRYHARRTDVIETQRGEGEIDNRGSCETWATTLHIQSAGYTISPSAQLVDSFASP